MVGTLAICTYGLVVLACGSDEGCVVNVGRILASADCDLFFPEYAPFDVCVGGGGTFKEVVDQCL